jgi:hypothetical protein
MIRLALALVLALAACGGGGAPTPMDAPPLKNQPFGAACTIVSDTSTECTSGVCTNSVNMSATPLCSQKCTMLMSTDPSCPSGSMGQFCNGKGYCRP